MQHPYFRERDAIGGRIARILTATLFVLFVSACGDTGDTVSPAAAPDLILVNGDIHTVDAATPRAEGFAVREGRFVAVGTSAEMQALASEQTRVIDAGGATVLPGLIDGHTHLAMGMTLATGVDLTEIEDKAEWLERVAEAAATRPKGTWIRGGNWDHNLSDGILPTRQMLDSVAPDHPVFLNDIDGHSYWVNTLALELAGITAASVAPPGGEIVLDAETGEPTGILKEGARGPVFAVDGFAAANDPVVGLPATYRLANSFGITGAHDMSDFSAETLDMLDQGTLTLRLWRGRFGLATADDVADYATERDQVRARIGAASVDRGPLFDLGYVKLMVDGVLSTHTALMKEPYTDRADADPLPITDQATLDTLVAASHANGFPVAIHAIGDRGVAMALNAFAASERPAGLTLPDRVEHIEVVTPDDVARFKALGVVASMQPHHATCCVGNYVIARIGADRMPNAYVWRSMLTAGVPLVLSSDWTTSPLDPLVQIRDAMTRETRLDGTVQPWDEGQALTFAEALHAYTQGAANVTLWADEIGSISAGKWADFVVLDGPLDEPISGSLRDRVVQATYLAGDAVYQRQ